MNTIDFNKCKSTILNFLEFMDVTCKDAPIKIIMDVEQFKIVESSFSHQRHSIENFMHFLDDDRIVLLELDHYQLTDYNEKYEMLSEHVDLGNILAQLVNNYNLTVMNYV